jgi:predicted Zn finger-like uncharacterized protein
MLRQGGLGPATDPGRDHRPDPAGENMRLICPNCGAQYEVPDSVIPEAGRDVQCSGCGHTWFQRHHSHAQDAAQDPADDGWDDDADGDSLFADDADKPAPQPDSPPQAKPASPATAAAQDDVDEDDDEWKGFPQDPGLTDAPTASTTLKPDPEDPVSRLPEVEEDDYEEDPARDLPMPRRGLDTSVADLLREEAEREARARAAERGTGLETQPDLGLDTSSPAPAAPPDRVMASRPAAEGLRATRPSQPDPRREAAIAPAATATEAAPKTTQAASDDDRIAALAAAAVAESRRGLLPDIEEINSSLRATSDRRPARADDHDVPGKSVDPRQVPNPPRSRGFSRGFSITLLIAALLLVLYVFAPALAEAVPAVTPVLAGYVSAVDALRAMLDAQAQNLSRWLAEIASGTS